MVKHSEEPMNAMMLSKAGKTMAMRTNSTTTDTRMTILRSPRVNEVRLGEEERVCGSRPEKNSMVETMGRAARGTLVSGMMAMKMLMIMERDRG